MGLATTAISSSMYIKTLKYPQVPSMFSQIHRAAMHLDTEKSDSHALKEEWVNVEITFEKPSTVIDLSYTSVLKIWIYAT